MKLCRKIAALLPPSKRYIRIVNSPGVVPVARNLCMFIWIHARVEPPRQSQTCKRIRPDVEMNLDLSFCCWFVQWFRGYQPSSPVCGHLTQGKKTQGCILQSRSMRATWFLCGSLSLLSRRSSSFSHQVLQIRRIPCGARAACATPADQKRGRDDPIRLPIHRNAHLACLNTLANFLGLRT
jgi:hypothetical protein